jgi:hypothetical protein
MRDHRRVNDPGRWYQQVREIGGLVAGLGMKLD